MSKHTLVAILASMIALTGCVDDKSGVHITGVLTPENEDGVCAAAPDAPSSGLVTWDLDSATLTPATSLTLFLGVENQLVERRTDIAVNPNGVDIQGAEVELLDVGGNRLDLGGLPNPFSMPASVQIPSGDETSAGAAALVMSIIPASYAGALPADVTILVSMRLFGETWGQQEIETDKWTFPLQLCRGCLIQCLPPGGTPLIPCTCGVGLPGGGCTVACP